MLLVCSRVVAVAAHWEVAAARHGGTAATLEFDALDLVLTTQSACQDQVEQLSLAQGSAGHWRLMTAVLLDLATMVRPH